MTARAQVASVTLVRRAIDAYNRRDVEALQELMSEDVRLRPPVSELTGRAYLGPTGVAEWVADVEESFASAQIDPIEVRTVGERVLALTEFRVQGHGGGVPLASELGLVCEVVDGRISSWVGYFNHAEAREAAGG